LTKKPTKPMRMNPRAVLPAILLNSADASKRRGQAVEDNHPVASHGPAPLRSGFVQRFTRRTLFLAKSLRGFTTTSALSMVPGPRQTVLQMFQEVLHYTEPSKLPSCVAPRFCAAAFSCKYLQAGWHLWMHPQGRLGMARSWSSGGSHTHPGHIAMAWALSAA
jgi:hypothetical protein